MTFREVLFGRLPRQKITKEKIDRTVERLSKGTLAEAERCLGVSQPFHPSGRRRYLRVLSSKERAERKRRVDRFLRV